MHLKTQTFLICRAHLEASAEKWNKLLTSLEEFVKWLNLKDEELKRQMPIGGDVPALQQQYDHCKVSCPPYYCLCIMCVITLFFLKADIFYKRL